MFALSTLYNFRTTKAVTRIWARRGSRPRVIRQQQFEYAYIFGAVCPKRGQAVGLILPTIGTFCMQKHLDEIGKHVQPGNHGVIIFDQAAWHTTKKLRLPENISLLSLPAASPKLNPTEQVWQVLRDRYLGNRCFDSYEHIIIAFQFAHTVYLPKELQLL